MYRSSPLRSTLNTSYIRFGYVSVSSMYRSTRCDKKCKKRVQKPKLGPAKRARKRVRGAFQGRRTSRFAGICIYMYILHIYTYITPEKWMLFEVARSRCISFGVLPRPPEIRGFFRSREPPAVASLLPSRLADQPTNKRGCACGLKTQIDTWNL